VGLFQILFRFSLAMFKYFEDVLMEQTDQNAANKFLRNLGDRVTDLRKLQTVSSPTNLKLQSQNLPQSNLTGIIVVARLPSSH
jgi:hypothetical protein